MLTDVHKDADGLYRAGLPNIAIPPGETLAELLTERQMSQAALARAMGRPVQMVSEIVRGKKAITAETALALERVLGLAAVVWVRLEADYRLTAARLRLQAGRSMSRTACGTARTRLRAAAATKTSARAGVTERGTMPVTTRKSPRTTAKTRTAGKRTKLTNASGTHYIRRRADGTIKSEVAVGKSLAADRRTKAKTTVKKGQGDRGDVRRGDVRR